jgi:ribosomal protein L29
MNENDQDASVKVIRLTTGEDVVGTCIFDYTPDEENVLLINPMLVMFNRLKSRGNSVLLMAPWLPAEILEENMVLITYDNILTIMNPKQDFIEYYQHYADKFNQHVEEKELLDSLDNLSDDELKDEMDELENEDIEEEFLKHILQSEDTSKKKTIH